MKWTEFKHAIDGLLPKTPKFQAVDQNGDSRHLFRGHGDSRWELSTTLERSGRTNFSLARYMQICTSARRFIENQIHTNVPFDEDVKCDLDTLMRGLPNYEYLAFLRHHGFPSPLLDWTESPYVAAFFAFREIPKDAKSVRIYTYQSIINHSRSVGLTTILPQGPFASIHERHSNQQCWYTISVSGLNDNDCTLVHHNNSTTSRVQDPNCMMQDVVSHWDIDASGREEALADLFLMNITPYTLFRTTDALIETAAWRIL